MISSIFSSRVCVSMEKRIDVEKISKVVISVEKILVCVVFWFIALTPYNVS